MTGVEGLPDQVGELLVERREFLDAAVVALPVAFDVYQNIHGT